MMKNISTKIFRLFGYRLRLFSAHPHGVHAHGGSPILSVSELQRLREKLSEKNFGNESVQAGEKIKNIQHFIQSVYKVEIVEIY
jgi:hypothetical protein